jgi:hypothetical protein
MIFHSPLLNILINLVSVGKYNFLNWGTFVPQGTVYGVFLMGTVPGLKSDNLTKYVQCDIHCTDQTIVTLPFLSQNRCEMFWNMYD